MLDVAVLEEPGATAAAVDPMRARLLALLAVEASSAAALAKAVDVARQKVTYHLRVLAEHGLVVEVGQRKHGGLTERLYAASAKSYVVSPATVGAAGADPARVGDHLSASYLLALAGRAIQEVGALLRGADAAGKRLSTLSVDTDICFRSAADRAAFTEDLAAAVRELATRYHDESVPNGRWHRFVAFSHPRPEEHT
ncbi:helix-turn-helix domain-containing protein [Actinospongicola halichondriae]|uniref:helix-turn-helix domain-containing protein n=1 Tax=Actinospongicola halichondriae TaxID=3236844 RepID=UPI003D440715